jgi:hypothetical protein
MTLVLSQVNTCSVFAEAASKRLNSNVRHRRGAQVTGSPFALRHEQDFD